MRIDDLADHPDWMHTVATWQHEAFSYLAPSKTLQDRLLSLQTTAQREGLPLGLVAHSGDGTLWGCASVVRRTLTHDHLGPWLSAVYVAPAHRNRGIASALTERAAAESARLGFPELFLFTPHNEALYRRLGWLAFDRVVIRDTPAAVMKRRVQSR